LRLDLATRSWPCRNMVWHSSQVPDTPPLEDLSRRPTLSLDHFGQRFLEHLLAHAVAFQALD
jgi:hypothetical protein